jgi:hypothetical protein
MHFAGLVGVVGGDNVRVIELGGSAGFLLKAGERTGLVEKIRIDDFQRDRPAHVPMIGAIDSPHAAPAKKAAQAITRVVRQFRRFFVLLDKCRAGDKGLRARQLIRFAKLADEAIVRRFFQKATAAFANGQVIFDGRRFAGGQAPVSELAQLIGLWMSRPARFHDCHGRSLGENSSIGNASSVRILSKKIKFSRSVE